MQPPLISIRLHPGQAHGFRAETGTSMLVENGSVTVSTAPRWLAGMVWRSQLLITAGEVHVFDADGWVTLCAEGGAAELWRLPARASHNASHRFTGALLSFARRTFA